MVQSLHSQYSWKRFSLEDMPLILHHQKELYSLNFMNMNFDETFYSNIKQWYTDGINLHHCFSNLLFDLNGELIGFYLYQWNEDTVYLMQMFVKKKYRRQGYGSLLLNHYEYCGRTQGAWSSFLHASTIHPRAVDFYDHNGYQVINEELDEQGYLRVLMFKPLV